MLKLLELLKGLNAASAVAAVVGVWQKVKANPSLYAIYALTGLLMLTLMVWGGREVHYRHLVKTYSSESSDLKTQLDSAKTSLTKAEQEISAERRILTQTQTLTKPDGTKLELSNSLNESWTNVYTALVEENKQRETVLRDLLQQSESKRADLEVRVTKQAPRYALLAGYDILGGQDWRERTKVGAGLNIANTTLGLSVRPFGPAATAENDLSHSGWWARFHPAAEMALRF